MTDRTAAKRQREYKSRLKAAGKQQLTLWVTPAEAEAIRAYLAGEADIVETFTASGTPSHDFAAPEPQPSPPAEPPPAELPKARYKRQPDGKTTVFVDGEHVATVWKDRAGWVGRVAPSRGFYLENKHGRTRADVLKSLIRMEVVPEFRP